MTTEEARIVHRPTGQIFECEDRSHAELQHSRLIVGKDEYEIETRVVTTTTTTTAWEKA